MKHRVFTRRRHAKAMARRCLRLATWLGAPVAVAAMVWDVSRSTDMLMVGPAAFAAVAIVYMISVLRVHELTGEWTFY